MVIKKAVQVGNPIIRAKAKEVHIPLSRATRKIVTDLIDSMRHYDLVGMAAPQIGKSVRIFVTEVRKTKYRKKELLDPLRVFINPRITSRSTRKLKDWEGCGSVASANLFGKVSRPASITVEAYDLQGNKSKTKAAGLFARIVQHEMDHLDGKVFTDHADTKTYMSANEHIKMRIKARA